MGGGNWDDVRNLHRGYNGDNPGIHVSCKVRLVALVLVGGAGLIVLDVIHLVFL